MRCRRCGHRELRDYPVRSEADAYTEVDPDLYRRSMSAERLGAARALMADLTAAGATGPLLDVGCSYGWMLEAASEAGWEAYGIEPSDSAVEASRARGLNVMRGHFPAQDWGRRDWGVISFLDVLEHIGDLEDVLREAAGRLRRSGFLALQLPVSTGIVYRISSVVERLTLGAVDGPLRRMLQLDFAYPHLHYFSRESLEALLHRFGFRTVAYSYSPIATGNFEARVSFQGRSGFGQKAQAAALRGLVAAGRATRSDDLLRLIARRD